MPENVIKEIVGVIKVEEKKLVGFRVVCNEAEEYQQEIPKAVTLLSKRKNEINQLVHPVKQMGAFKAQEDSEDEDGYWVCYEVQGYESVPEDMVTLTIPTQTYGVLHYKGPASGIMHTYNDLHQWMKDKNYQRCLNLWTLEIYSNQEDSDVEAELYDPIMSL